MDYSSPSNFVNNMNVTFDINGNLQIDQCENSQHPTQISNTEGVFHFSNLDEVQLVTPSDQSSKRCRGGNFTIEEDLLIVSAWLNISLDAVHGNDQKHRKYWTRVSEYFNKYKKFDSDRSQVSLMNRWSAIQLATNKFCGCYAQIESRHKSGTNEQDKIGDAKLFFKALYKNKFQFEHCWNVLRLQPKWMEDCQKKKPAKKKGKSDTTLETPINLEDESIANSGLEDAERPPGRKAEKEKMRKKNKVSDNDSTGLCMTLLQEMKEEKKQFNEKKLQLFEKVYAQGQDRLSFDQDKLRLEQMKEDERIMGIDTSGLPEILATFYLQRQEEIMQRMSKNC